MVWVATAVALPAQTFTTLHSFAENDGAYPYVALVQGTDGNFYGTTVGGGAYGYGSVFRISSRGSVTTLYSFCVDQSQCSDGAVPTARLLLAADGDFYGTTSGGGAHGWGTVFKITSSGTFTSLYSFCPQRFCPDAAQPEAGLIQGGDGNFYGTTELGGANNSGQCSQNGCGTVFKITPGGRLTTLYSFCSQSDCTDGQNPLGGLVLGTDGSFYGTTTYGGTPGGCPGNGCGTIFKISPNGVLTTLHSFDSIDGALPYAGLVQASDGNFYGTTLGGGVNESCLLGCGTVFKVTSSGTLTTLYNFCSQTGCSDGEYAPSGVVQATDGDFYGITQGGEYNTQGTAFKISTNGALKTLYSFCAQSGCMDGRDPWGALVQATNGTFYGTTEFGGAHNLGTAFSLSVGLHPFVETQPTSGPVGQPAKILGTNLTGATGVTFNGTAAQFTVVSSSYITTTVPAGATTGYVQVTTPKGTLKSNVQFRVKP